MNDHEGRNLLIGCLVCLILFVSGIIIGAKIERANAPLYSSIKMNQDFIMLEIEKINIREPLLSDLLKILADYGMEVDRLVIHKDGVKQLDTRLID
jgi:hypothetical protein